MQLGENMIGKSGKLSERFAIMLKFSINDTLQLSCARHQLGNSSTHINVQQVSTF
jgi:hypothetical protein